MLVTRWVNARPPWQRATVRRSSVAFEIAVGGGDLEELAKHCGCEAAAREAEAEHNCIRLAGPLQVSNGQAQAAALLIHPGVLHQSG